MDRQRAWYNIVYASQPRPSSRLERPPIPKAALAKRGFTPMVNRRKMDAVWLPTFIASASGAFLFTGRWVNTNTSRYSAEAAKLERTVAETVQNDRGETQMELKNAEEKVQLSLQIAERAIAERNAIEAQLKEVEGKARLAQLVKQSADLAPSERNI